MNRIILVGRNDRMPRLTGPAYDATEGRWLQPPSGMKPDAEAAADLQRAGEDTLFSAKPLSQGPVAQPLEATGHLVASVLLNAIGLVLFGLVGAFFITLVMVLA